MKYNSMVPNGTLQVRFIVYFNFWITNIIVYLNTVCFFQNPFSASGLTSKGWKTSSKTSFL